MALVDVDLVQLRKSPLWPFLRRTLGARSVVADVCLIDRAQRIELSLHYVARSKDEGSSMAVAAVFQGLSTAEVRTCIEGARGVSAKGTPGQAGACHALGEVIGSLVHCGKVPLSSAPELVRTAELWRDVSDDGIQQACTQSLGSWTKAAARCAARTAEPELAARSMLRPREFLNNGSEELVSIDDHAVRFGRAGNVALIGQVGSGGGAAHALAVAAAEGFESSATWLAELRRAGLEPGAISLLAAPAALAALDSSRGAKGESVLPRRLLLSVETQRDVTVKLKAEGLSAGAAASAIGLLRAVRSNLEAEAAQPLVVASCTMNVTGPQAAPCAAALGNKRRLDALDGSIPSTPNVAEQIETADWQALCAAVDSSAYTTCLENATSPAMRDACTLEIPDHETSSNRLVCGTGQVAAELTFSLPALARIANAWVREGQRLRDCVDDRDGAVDPDDAGDPDELEQWQLAHVQLSSSFDLAVCFAGSGCWFVESSAPPGDGDAAFHFAEGSVPSDSCGAVPLTATASGRFANWSFGAKACNGIDYSMWDDELHLRRRVEEQHELAAVPVPKATQAIGISPNAEVVVFVVGKPGKQVLETWDVRAKRRVARIAVPARPPCVRALALGRALAVSSVPCEQSPEEPVTVQLLSLEGKPLATIPQPVQPRPLPLGDTRWGFLTAPGNALLIYDIATGALVKRMETSIAPSAEPLASDADVQGRFALAYGAGELAGTVVLGDAKSGAVRTFKLSRCPR